MERVYPVAFLPQNHALAVAIMSYAGEMNFGLLGDFDALPDIESIGESIAEELAALVAIARERQAEETAKSKKKPKPVRTRRAATGVSEQAMQGRTERSVLGT